MADTLIERGIGLPLFQKKRQIFVAKRELNFGFYGYADVGVASPMKGRHG